MIHGRETREKRRMRADKLRELRLMERVMIEAGMIGKAEVSPHWGLEGPRLTPVPAAAKRDSFQRICIYRLLYCVGRLWAVPPGWGLQNSYFRSRGGYRPVVKCLAGRVGSAHLRN